MFNFKKNKSKEEGLKNKTGIKNAFIIQSLNSFISGVTYILLPLLMLERGISVESMGLVFAVLPLVSQTNRLLFGIVSDHIGRKKFYWLNGFMNIISLMAYYLAQTPFGFLIGKINEGIRNASLWSVNRAYFLDHSQKGEETLVKMRGIGSISHAFGILLAGFLVTMFFFSKTLALLIAISFLIFPNVKKLIDKKKREISILAILEALSFKNKSEKFKKFFALFFISGLYWGLIGGYVFPLFLKEKGIGVENIGVVLGVKTLLAGIFIYALRSVGSSKNKLLIGALFYSLFLIVLPFSTESILLILIILLGISGGISDAGHEAIFIEVANHGSIAGDIGILMIGTHVGMSITQALSGFAISSFGFPVVFLIAAALNVFYSVFVFRNMS